jgi:hypothetical protein
VPPFDDPMDGRRVPWTNFIARILPNEHANTHSLIRHENLLRRAKERIIILGTAF